MRFTYSMEDKNQITEKGVSQDRIDEQLDYFENGIPSLNIQRPATLNDGITKMTNENQAKYISIWNEYLKTNKRVTKFVPASGAASRMFKDLFEFLENESEEPVTEFEKQFFDNIDCFAFYDELNQKCIDFANKNIKELISQKEYKTVVKLLLNEEGLSYGELPKGLLLFHSYSDSKRTPMEEHLVEGAMYAKDDKGMVDVHFTISPHHQLLFEHLLNEKKNNLENTLNTSFNVSFSIQKPSTDTIAVDLNNEPFRDEDNKLLFRPGGHGALIENLNDLHSDIVFVKNIDNVMPDKYKKDEANYKKMLAGILVEKQQIAFNYLSLLESNNYSINDLKEMKSFVEEELCTTSKNVTENNEKQLTKYLIKKLDRPFRVCGIVRNMGEAGGGPFIVENKDGSFSPQILEASQIREERFEELADKSTHFNPVDLVCGMKDRKGNKYNLMNFVDNSTGFISSKSINGKPLKAFELPGLWNGAMSDWNTVFVEVPISTFNPVKTVNDLLRDEHQ